MFVSFRMNMLVAFATSLCVLALSGKVAGNKECYRTPKGNDYTGTVNTTVEGLACQRWDKQTPHRHSFTKAYHFPDLFVKYANNYCRNPHDAEPRPWCYTMNSTERWDFCDIPKCDEAQSEKLKECYTTPKGIDYMGTVNVTVTGRTCQRWDSQFPHSHRFKEAANFYSDTDIQDTANYCRNPEADEGRPWCYTTDPDKKWEFCDVPKCCEPKTLDVKECYRTTDGIDYRGTVSTTVTGRTCQRWDQQTPHVHWLPLEADFSYVDKTIRNASNYCRNPDHNEGKPFCFTADSFKRWEFCDVPMCNNPFDLKSCYATRFGDDYMGTVNKTRTGRTCQRWDAHQPHRHRMINGDFFPADKDIQAAANYCRNPKTDKARPWCYTIDPDKRWEFCNVKRCNMSGGNNYAVCSLNTNE